MTRDEIIKEVTISYNDYLKKTIVICKYCRYADLNAKFGIYCNQHENYGYEYCSKGEREQK